MDFFYKNYFLVYQILRILIHLYQIVETKVSIDYFKMYFLSIKLFAVIYLYLCI